MGSRLIKDMKHLTVQDTRSRVNGSLNNEKTAGKETKIKLEISSEMIKNIIHRVEEL